MAGTITSAGLGSGIDIESLVTKLMSIEQQPITKLQTKDKSFDTKLSAFGTLKSSLSSLQTAAEAISSAAKFSAYQASIADSTIGTVSAGSSASAGSYQLEVSSLASSQKVVTTAQSSSYTFADGTLSFDVAGKVTNIDISAAKGNNTLAKVRDAINASGAGVSASLLSDGNGTRLILTASQSGTDNGFTVSGLGLGFDPNDIASSDSLVDQSTSKAATNAVFTLDGVQVTRSSNVISDALDGVTLTLNKKNIGTPTTLNITQDGTAIQKKVEDFITAYNNVVNTIKTQTAWNNDTKTAAALNGDAAVRGIQSQLRSIVSGSLSSGSLTRLSDIGIKIETSGTLTLDSTKFKNVLADPTKDIGSLFAEGTVSGFADQIADRVKEFLGTDGLLTSRTDGIKKTQLGIDKQIETLEARMTVIEARYRKQFTALDTSVASWNSTGNYLTTQLSSLLTKYTNN
ncbi:MULTISPECIES: flagellar filament capping protein FliD [unclassified Uliginosibacterium]|uniref:flagellar filament capping protein FliD n=1 Tax=unclassified Uliginosibacterium TaxID=2621521 RepID=UPI000C7BF1B6|nr:MULTISPECIES: flagellar filament capping protein FliD [unclassified Uliginosibacterium]MDO6385104.1 flagellar filament capping protein FliD [Uliginosibacterium sp. 31-12]PLK48781.1 flagellar hook-associated protein [Uliginosibacterium sp. TH139]